MNYLSSDSISITLSILFFILGGGVSWIITKLYQKRISLSCIHSDLYWLVDSISEKFSSIKLHHNDKPISDNILMFRGTILNTGNRDIDSKMHYEPFKVIFPPTFKFLEVIISKSSPNVNAIAKIIDNTVVFEWDVLKESEFFSFEIILEYIKAVDDKEELNHILPNVTQISPFKHRILGLSNIKYRTTYNEVASRTKLILKTIVTLLLVVGLVAWTVWLASAFKRARYSIEYFQNENNIREKLNLTIENDSLVRLSSKDNSINYVVPASKIVEIPFIEIAIKKNKHTALWIFTGISYLAFVTGLFMYSLITYLQFRNRRVVKMVE